MKTRITSFRLGIELVSEVDKLASHFGKNRNTLVAEVLEIFVREQRQSGNEAFEKGVRR